MTKKKKIILTAKKVQELCSHEKKHISSFSNRIMVCDECGKFFDRYVK